MVQASSSRMVFVSFCSEASSDTFAFESTLAVVPLFPTIWDSGACGISVEDEGKEAAEDDVGVSVANVFGDAFEGDEPANCLDNKPEIRHRLRAFHIV